MNRPLLLAVSVVRRMLLHCRRDLARASGKGGWTAYYYPSGQSGHQEQLDQPPDQPPDEAYGRVTNPERFEPLHSAMLETISRLEETFDVVRIEGYGLDEELEGRRGIARPSSNSLRSTRMPRQSQSHFPTSQGFSSVSDGGSPSPFPLAAATPATSPHQMRSND